MGKQETRAALAKVEGLLAMVVGVQKMTHMTIPDFLAHAQSEITKAASEPVEKSRVRLSLLYKSVLYTAATIEDAESDAIKVPVFVADQTTLGEQASELHTPAATSPGKGSFFEGDLKKFVEDFASKVRDLGAVLKVGEGEEEDDVHGKRGGKKPPFPPEPPKKPDAAAEAAEKALPDSAFLLTGKSKDGKKDERKFPFKNKDGEVDPDALKKAIGDIAKADDLDDDEKEMLADKAKRLLAAQKKIGKGLAKGEVVWPDDLNDPTFVKKGHGSEGEWGPDET